MKAKIINIFGVILLLLLVIGFPIVGILAGGVAMIAGSILLTMYVVLGTFALAIWALNYE